MKILYDYQAFLMQKFGGVSNCFVQLIKNLPKDVDYEIAVCESDNGHLRESGLIDVEKCSLDEKNFISSKTFKGRRFLYRNFSRFFPRHTSLGRNHICAIEALTNSDYDIFHPTFYDPYFLPFLNNKPFVLTVHDMIPELFCNKKNPQVMEKPHLCYKAAHIIAVSEKTKEDLINILDIDEHKISVIYHGSPEYTCVTKGSPLIEESYLLYVGMREGYKFFKEMLIHLIPIIRKYPYLRIVCTGNEFTKEELAFFQKYGIYENLMHIHPSDSEMINLYSHALCFIYPSIYEGFGIPILEAYKAGCPVLLNNRSCFPEIARDAALYFYLDENCSNLEEVMEVFLNMSNSERIELIDKQYERLKFFSWEKSSRELSDIYKKVLETAS